MANATVVAVLPANGRTQVDGGLPQQEAVDLEAGRSPAARGGSTPSSRMQPRSSTGPRALLRRLCRCLPGPVRYPMNFKILVMIVVFFSIAWVSNYLAVVVPTIDEHKDTPCKYNDNQLTYNAKMLFIYFLWFAVARLSLFLPGIAHRVALVQSRTHGFCRTYCIHLVLRDGPLYIYAVGSMLFWFHLMQSPSCEERSPDLYQVLKLYAIYSCLLSILCLALTYWHNKLLISTVREVHLNEESRRAPDGTLEKLETLVYDPEVFGDEEGKRYPAECAICLATWEAEDVIKVTHCHHAFHQDCLGHWLETARTCALCRQDLTKPFEQSPTTLGSTTLTGVSLPDEQSSTLDDSDSNRRRNSNDDVDDVEAQGGVSPVVVVVATPGGNNNNNNSSNGNGGGAGGAEAPGESNQSPTHRPPVVVDSTVVTAA